MLNPMENPTSPIHQLTQQVNYLLAKTRNLEFHSKQQNNKIKEQGKGLRVLQDRVSDLVRLHTLHCIEHDVPWDNCIPFPNDDIKNWFGSTPLSQVLRRLSRGGRLPSDAFFEQLDKKGVHYSRADAEFLSVMLGVQYQGDDEPTPTPTSTSTPISPKPKPTSEDVLGDQTDAFHIEDGEIKITYD